MVLVEELSDASTPHEEDEAYSYDYDDDDDDASLTPSEVFEQIMGPTVKLPIHEHSLYNHHSSEGHCDGCPELRENGLHGYNCHTCTFTVHKECAESLPKINHPSHQGHPLTLQKHGLPLVSADDSYRLCGAKLRKLCYLPRVIGIIRHTHRISRTYLLGVGDWTCGVCRRRINGRFGAYSCSICPDYVVHSRCATRGDVWDGRELEDEPEENDECEEPFRVVSDGVINHFSHREHDLRLEDGVSNIHDDEYKRCRACVRPVYSDRFYSCVQCDDFNLHETCANLPRKKRHVLHNHQLTLYNDERIVMGFPMTSGVFLCSLLVTDYAVVSDSKICVVCKQESSYVLTCMDCDFVLDFKCATLPNPVSYKYDVHPLTLCYDGDKDLIGSYWCEICEREMDQRIMFYTCESSGPTIHIDCVLGDFRYMKPRLQFEFNGKWL
ncbi:uncharacterized protein LOC112088356 [Eutrema salsugineum]|uniref:uncharacterized protein LOC112088356 n=1 Tax=Eutrema salsugineum TaxID=72664 RepID=UPI000CED325B|nr:uncharacterized protein LOC112088356 [Eutrema salsugineum]